MKKLILLFTVALGILASSLHAETAWTKKSDGDTYEITPAKHKLCRVVLTDQTISFYAHDDKYYGGTAVESVVFTKQEGNSYTHAAEIYMLKPHVKGSYHGTDNMLLFKEKSVPLTMDKVAGGYPVFTEHCAAHIAALPDEVQTILNKMMISIAAH